MLSFENLAPENIRPITRAEYQRLVELGLFADERVELLHGVLVAMSPQGSAHAEVCSRLTEGLVLALQGRARVRSHSPLAAGELSSPEPDVAVVASGDHTAAHPDGAFLVIEVSDASLRKDRTIKAALYASRDIPEYWIVNLRDRLIEIHREPKDGSYAHIERRGRAETIAPAAFLDVELRIGDLIP